MHLYHFLRIHMRLCIDAYMDSLCAISTHTARICAPLRPHFSRTPARHFHAYCPHLRTASTMTFPNSGGPLPNIMLASTHRFDYTFRETRRNASTHTARVCAPLRPCVSRTPAGLPRILPISAHPLNYTFRESLGIVSCRITCACALAFFNGFFEIATRSFLSK